MRRDIANFKTSDILVAVIFAVVARLYALFGSPAANAWLQSMGPSGQFLATFAIGVLYFILLLAAVIRGNFLVCYVASVLMAVIRILTGDPFGPVALQSYLFGGLTGWIAFAAMGNRHTYVSWMVTSAFYAMGLDFVFYTFYLPVTPILGSDLLGWFVLVVVYRVLLGIILGAI